MLRTSILALAVGVLALTGGNGAGAAPPLDGRGGRDFLRLAVRADNGEIALGRLAIRRAASAEVRAFARLLVADHGRSRQLALDLARPGGVTEPMDTSAQAQAELGRLRALSGRAFDREFVRYIAADHRMIVHDYRAEAARRQGRASRLAQLTVPTLRKHLRMAQALAPKVD